MRFVVLLAALAASAPASYVGEVGPTGAPGATGEKGPRGGAPVVTVRKALCDSGTGCGNGLLHTAVAYCQPTEMIVGGGCFLPYENDAAVNSTGSQPRIVTGAIGSIVAPGASNVQATSSGATQIFGGEHTGAVALGSGWACRAGHVSGTASVLTGPYYGSWLYNVAAYAICLERN